MDKGSGAVRLKRSREGPYDHPSSTVYTTPPGPHSNHQRCLCRAIITVIKKRAAHRAGVVNALTPNRASECGPPDPFSEPCSPTLL